MKIKAEDQAKKSEKEKAKRIQKLDGSLKKLRKQVKKDLTCDEKEKCLTALAVALLDESAGRMGNIESVNERDHYGISTLKRKHITFHSNGTATLKYTGKSGVNQEKKIENKAIAKALKTMTTDIKEGDYIFRKREDATNVTRTEINEYLSEYGITAKDIRGHHANKYLQDKLKKIGVPKDEKDRKKTFEKVIKDVASQLGHETATLKGNYLVPGFEKLYIEEGKIIDKFDKKSFHQTKKMAERVARKWLSINF